MDDPTLFSRYEQRENTGKVVGEKKYQPKAVKDVERKLATLGKKITELQRHRKRAYNNSARFLKEHEESFYSLCKMMVKKNIHHQVNQIVKSFRERERTLLADVDESYISQVSSIDDELEKLLTTNICCQTLYSGLYDFRENRNVLYEINDILSSANLDEKPEYKRLELISSMEQAKLYANNYGSLDREFVRKDLVAAKIEDGDSSTIDRELSPNKVPEQQTCSDLKTKFLENNHKRERTESQDSFELVELLESIHCHDNKDLDEKNKSKDLLNSSIEDESDNLTEEFPESSAEPLKKISKKEEYLCLEERIMKINEQLEVIVSSSPKFNMPHGKVIKTVKQVQGSEEKTGSSKFHSGYESWLHITPKTINAMEMDDVKNYSGANTITPADLIKKAFSPYLANKNVESWLAFKH